MQTIQASQALMSQGWRNQVEIDVGDDGTISAVRTDCDSVPSGNSSVALPAPSNLHSHTFQRAMAGLTEKRGPTKTDSFWTWRDLMYRFLDHLTPDDIEAIAAQAFVEMLESGYGAVAEFHYVHHQRNGAPYDDLTETTQRIFAAASECGIGLTHLPVLYTQGGIDGRPLEGGQLRFGCDTDLFAKLHDESRRQLDSMPDDSRLGVAPHSLRAVSEDELAIAAALDVDEPIHIHVAEQTAEIDEVEAALAQRPVRWLFGRFDVNQRWCLVHATQIKPDETEALARSGAVVGLCPITESNLGDGVFDGRRFITAGGVFGVGSDSNVRIALSEELRTLEYTQRQSERQRVVMATAKQSTGRFLYESACLGGSKALGRDCGVIEPGKVADLTVLDGAQLGLDGAGGDEVLDKWIFTDCDRLVSDVWSAGRHVVAEGRHKKRRAIEARYRDVVSKLRSMV